MELVRLPVQPIPLREQELRQEEHFALGPSTLLAHEEKVAGG
jgi:hypothetical protein